MTDQTTLKKIHKFYDNTSSKSYIVIVIVFSSVINKICRRKNKLKIFEKRSSINSFHRFFWISFWIWNFLKNEFKQKKFYFYTRSLFLFFIIFSKFLIISFFLFFCFFSVSRYLNKTKLETCMLRFKRFFKLMSDMKSYHFQSCIINYWLWHTLLNI